MAVVFSILLLILYGIFTGLFTLSWYRMKDYKTQKSTTHNLFLSIIIPVRNEEANLLRLLDSIKRQTFPSYLFEIIIIDDHSTDRTLSLAKAFQQAHPELIIQIIQTQENAKTGAYKKNAISQAIRVAAGELIITTDGDTVTEPHWLQEIASYYRQTKAKMIVGPVKYEGEQNIFEKMQSIEFLSLIGITAGAIGIRMPLMCNGANLIYQKSAFEEVNGYEGDRFTSGDDVMLMLKIKKKFGASSIRFLKSPRAFVHTSAQKNLRDFLIQRGRWASKNKHFQPAISAVALLVFLTNFMLVLDFFFALSGLLPFTYLLLFLLSKMLIDFPLVAGILKFAKKRRLSVFFIPLAIIYPLYIVVSAIYGMFGKFTWKGRVYTK